MCDENSHISTLSMPRTFGVYNFTQFIERFCNGINEIQRNKSKSDFTDFSFNSKLFED